MSQPTPPRDVRVVLPDGEQIRVQAMYVGLQDGIHVWEVAWPFPGFFAGLRADMLPARTALRLTYGHAAPPDTASRDN